MGASLQFDQAGDRLAVAPATGQQRHRHRIDAAVGAKGQQGIDGAALERAIQRIAGLEVVFGCWRAIEPVTRPALLRAHPAFLAHHHRHGLVHHLDFEHHFFLGLDQSAARISEGLGVGLDFFHHQAAQRRRAAQNFFQPVLLLTQTGQFLLDLDGLQTSQLAQADFKNVLSLPLRQIEACDQGRLGFVGLADDGDHLVDVEQHQRPALQDVDAVQHLVQAVPRAPLDGGVPERNPFGEHLAQRLERGPAIEPDHGQVDRA